MRKERLDLYFLVDRSGSMEGTIIEMLNGILRNSMKVLANEVERFPNYELLIHCISFSDKVKWHIGPAPVPAKVLDWHDIQVAIGGTTATSKAINLLSDEFERRKRISRVPPICVLITDGPCTDSPEEYKLAISRLNNTFLGKTAIRLACWIGEKRDTDLKQLWAFSNQIHFLHINPGDFLINSKILFEAVLEAIKNSIEGNKLTVDRNTLIKEGARSLNHDVF
ncbi:vWA domain-containing protein [Neobacillus sp. D3-1R]|uniref:vWA domain-containing protein n=1 Tax=Neobacillus sp. D3-1R TaxID=3445778 RepID=UPI003F9EEB60